MKKALCFVTFILSSPLCAFHIGAGFSWNTIDENFKSNLFTNENKSGQDHYETSANRLAPAVTLGQEFCFCNDWIFDISAEWKYLNYRTHNVSSSVGQILPNATFSSINIFGSKVVRDFTSKTRLQNEVILLASLGKGVCNGVLYLGVGPVFYNASNRIFVSSVHTPNGEGDHLISTSVKKNRSIWGGAARIGYEYFVAPCSFLNLSYTYIQTGNYHFKNTVNAAILNGFNTPGPTTLFLDRSIEFAIQEFMLSLNVVF